jgi:hypothetical protein
VRSPLFFFVLLSTEKLFNKNCIFFEDLTSDFQDLALVCYYIKSTHVEWPLQQ